MGVPVYACPYLTTLHVVLESDNDSDSARYYCIINHDSVIVYYIRFYYAARIVMPCHYHHLQLGMAYPLEQRHSTISR